MSINLPDAGRDHAGPLIAGEATAPARLKEPAPPGSRAPAPTRPAPATPARRRRRLAAVAALVVVAGGIGYAMRPRSVTVDAVPAARGRMAVTVDADAVTRVRDQFTVTAPVGGLVHRIGLREGDPVARGQSVAYISPEPVLPSEAVVAEARVGAAAAAVRQAAARASHAESALVQAVRDAERTRRLAEAGALPEHDVESARLEVAARRADAVAARAQAAAAAAELAAARARRDAMAGSPGTGIPVRAPAAARVLHVVDRSARVVSPGAPLLQVGDPTSLEVVADVLSSDAALLRPGQPVLLRNSGAGELRGVVRVVTPSATTRVSALGVEEQRLEAIIDLQGSHPALGDGFKVDASITVWERGDVLTIPASALLRQDGRSRVYAVSDGRARERAVRIGHVGGGLAEVLGGLAAGDSVILFPPDDVKDGTRVRASP